MTQFEEMDHPLPFGLVLFCPSCSARLSRTAVDARGYYLICTSCEHEMEEAAILAKASAMSRDTGDESFVANIRDKISRLKLRQQREQLGNI